MTDVTHRSPAAELAGGVATRRGTAAIGVVALIAAVFLTYQPVWHAGFIWDDDAHVTVPALRSITGLWRIWFDLGATQQFYPLLHSAFWLEHKLWGDAATYYHLSNLAVHVIAACLFWTLLRRLVVPGAFFAACLFALHPVHVESVAWISELKNTLSTVFYLSAALIYLRYDAERRRTLYWAAFAFFVLALLTKTVTASLPGALLVIVWWRRGRLSWRDDIVPLLPWFVVGAAAGLFTAWVERHLIGAGGVAYDLTFLQRMLLAGRVVWFYVGKLFWPADLAFVYPRWSIDPGSWIQWLPLLGLAAVVAALWWRRAKSRALLAALLFFVGTLFPVLGFLNVYPFRFSFVADHFQYVASMGPLALVGAMGGYAVTTWRRKRFVAMGVCSAAVLAAATLTWRQAHHYRDAETLWRETLRTNPDAYLAHTNLGSILVESGRLDEAFVHYRASLALNPDLAETHFNLGKALQKLPGREPEAVAHFEQALQSDPGMPEAHLALADMLGLDPARRNEAIPHYEAALRRKPDSVEAHVNLCLLLAVIPARVTDAIAHGEAALRIRTDLPDAHFNLANALGATGRLPEAIAHYEQALKLKPGYLQAHVNLGLVLARDPVRRPDAIKHYQAALAVEPKSAVTHNNLAIVLFESGRTVEAISHFERAVEIDPDYVDARNNLARVKAMLATP